MRGWSDVWRILSPSSVCLEECVLVGCFMSEASGRKSSFGAKYDTYCSSIGRLGVADSHSHNRIYKCHNYLSQSQDFRKSVTRFLKVVLSLLIPLIVHVAEVYKIE